MAQFEEVRNALRMHGPALRSRANVVATGVGFKISGNRRTRDLSLVCSVAQKVPLASISERDRVPAQLDGIPTDVVPSGIIRALANTGRMRPAPGGISIGHRDITAGTLGCLVKRNGQVMILSNNHVLANSNAATAGDPILQPGAYDGGTLPADRIAVLEQFVPISFGDTPSDCGIARAVSTVLNAGCAAIGSRTRFRIYRAQAATNLVDAAIARPLNAADVNSDIIDIGAIQGTARGELGMAVQKSGRTTSLTRGEIIQVDVTANVQYGAGQTATFTDQLMAGAMSQGGDSGSAVLNDRRELVGLLFAGSDSTTIINRIENVFSALNLTL